MPEKLPFNGASPNATMRYNLWVKSGTGFMLKPGDRVCIKSAHDPALSYVWGVSESGAVFSIPSGMIARDENKE